MKKFLWKMLFWFIFMAIVLSPFWSVVIVMEAESFEIRYHTTWTNHIYLAAREKAEWRKVGLDDKF
jgi:hypothetical protein